MGFICMEFAKNSFPSQLHDCLTLSQTKEVIRALIDVQIGMRSIEKTKDCFNVNVYEELYSEMLQPTLKTSYRHLFPTIALAFLTTVLEMFTASVKNCSEDERRRRTNRVVEKVRGILENINDFRRKG
ncbi:hypothetical protein GCK32_019562 [Trichostrongylus colubriformis]|uniref:Uncharacterized protein n=1 Tax=Trichostrongylus colubriformis TaxID=6319 RepID=A0AAN8FPS6_TRICO